MQRQGVPYSLSETTTLVPSIWVVTSDLRQQACASSCVTRIPPAIPLIATGGAVERVGGLTGKRAASLSPCAAKHPRTVVLDMPAASRPPSARL